MALATLPLLANAKSVYVNADSGNNANAGTQSSPYRTVAFAMTKVSAGDTIFLEDSPQSEYHETIVPISGITLAAADPAHHPVMRGDDGISYNGWNAYNGSANIYWRTMTTPAMSFGDGNQVFIDGVAQTYARWPNINPDGAHDLNHPYKATVDLAAASDGTNASLATSEPMPQPAAFYATNTDGNPTTLHAVLGSAWLEQTQTVGTVNPTLGEITFPYANSSGNKNYQPQAYNAFFLSGSLNFLDAPGEWFYHAADSKLYIWYPSGTPGDKTHTISCKTRQWGIDLSGKSNVTVDGIDLFACAIKTDPASSGNMIKNVRARYVAAFANDTNQRWVTGTYGWMQSSGLAPGLVLDGSGNTIQQCEIAYSAGYGILVTGTNNTVSDNVVHYVDYACSGVGGIGTGINTTVNPTITKNTVSVSGLRLIDIYKISGGDVSLNDLSAGGLQARDFGGVYCANTQGGSVGAPIARVDHNYIHDLVANIPGGLDNDSKGVYLDNGSGYFVVDHNVTSNVDVGIVLNSSCSAGANVDVEVYNNTLDAVKTSLAWSTSIMTGCYIQNNVCFKALQMGSGVVGTGSSPNILPSNSNIGIDQTTYLINSTTSACLNSGVTITTQYPSPSVNITSGYSGSAPDQGAHEADVNNLGVADWTAGSDVTPVY